ncbi:MAG: hypothetical protein AAF533_07475 [Acidobacteriota bacterium]
MLRSPVLAASCLLVLLPPLLATAGEPTSTTNAWARLDAEGFTVQRAADGTLRRMLGGAFELLSEDELVSLDARRDQRALVMAIEKLLTGPSGLLGLEADELRLTTSGPHPFGRSGLIVHHELVHDDVPVFGARVTTVLRGGRLTYLGRVGALPTTAATPSIGATTATSTTLRAAGLRPIGLMRPAVTDLYWKPVDDGHRLAWRVSVLAADTRRHHVGWVDALDGSLLELADATVEGCLGPAPAEAAGRVLGGVLPHGPDDDERLELLPSIEVGGVVAGLDGHFVDPALPTTVGLSGPVVNVDCVACTDPEHPAASVGADGDVSFGTGGSDTMGNGFASRADRTCYFHSEAARRQATRWLDLTWLDEQLQVDTNLPGNCNAYWNGTSLNFFQASDRCANAGEIQDVISHEWGHGLDTNDGLPSSPLSVDAATGEAVADIVAMLRSHDSCLGEGFFRSAADWPSADCSGVRELDEHAPGHVRGMPATLTVDNATTECPPSATYRGPLGAEGHCEGEIFGQAFWRLVQVLATGLDADGSPVAGGTALGEDVAWQVAERLFHDSRPLLASYAPSHLQSIGTSAHDAFLLVDDVGDGVADGTPHSWAIHAAFERHGMTEIGSMPLAEDGCTVPVTALSANAVFDTATGRPLVRLSWTAGADEVELLRSSEERDGFLLISDPLPPGSDMLVDRGVLGGRDYRYALVTVDATGCRSEPSIVTVTTPTAIMDVTGVRVDDTTTGDADGLLGVDEEVELFVTVANLSDAPLTGVTLGLDADAGFTLLAGGPFATADLAPGESRELAMAFRLRSDLLPPRVLRLPFTLEAAEGCLRADRLLDVHQPELVLVGERLDDSLFSDDQVFDPGETVELFFELENLGNLDATMVTGTLTFRGVPPAEVTLVADTAPWPALPIGAREWTSGPRFALEASPAVVLGTEIPLTLSLSVNGRVGPSFPVDIVVGGFPPGQLEWEVRTEELEPMGTGQAVNHPFVIQTNDDDGDGRITACDIPDVIFEVWNLGGVDGFHVLSGDDGRELTSFPVTACRDGWSTFQTFAVGDIDGDGEPELVTDRDNRNACAMELDGSLLWETERVVGFSIFPQPTKIAPNIADVDHDGRAEVIVGHSVIEGEDGTVAWSDLDGGAGGRSIVGDLDLDGELDIIGFEGRVRQADGTDLGTLFPELWKDGGLVQLDDDPEPELVYLGWPSDRVVYIQAREHDGTDIWRHDPPPGLDLRCPPCFGDLDGDGKTEMAQPGGTVMYAVDDDGSFMWSTPIDDSTGASGCSVFDFDLDGRAEVVHRDQRDLRVFLGATGKVLWSAPVSSQTLYECPQDNAIADGSTGNFWKLKPREIF